MDEKELIQLWKHDGLKEEKVRTVNTGQYEQIAKQKSTDVFQRIRRNIYAELPVSMVLAIGFPFIFWEHQLFFWLSALVMALALSGGLKINFNYLKTIDEVNADSLFDSLQQKRNILSSYINKLKVSTWVFAPLGFTIGFGFALKTQEEITVPIVSFVALFSLPFLMLAIWLTYKYIHALYGKYLSNIDDVLKGFLENN